MSVDDLFPEDEGGEDHPIMRLFDEKGEDFFDMVLRMMGEQGIPVTVVDSPPGDSATVSSP